MSDLPSTTIHIPTHTYSLQYVMDAQYPLSRRVLGLIIGAKSTNRAVLHLEANASQTTRLIKRNNIY